MKYLLNTMVIFFFITSADLFSQKNYEVNLVQSYSGKIGFYNPEDKLNNGFLIGIDGITEFIKHNLLLSLSMDFYFKKVLNPYVNEKPKINDQSFILFPIHINAGYKIFELADVNTRGYLGLGAGYYFYFYDVKYQSGSGIILGNLINKDASRQGGDYLFTFFGRILIGKIFIEPRLYFATADTETFDIYKIEIDPSGFAIMIGYQY